MSYIITYPKNIFPNKLLFNLLCNCSTSCSPSDLVSVSWDCLVSSDFWVSFVSSLVDSTELSFEDSSLVSVSVLSSSTLLSLELSFSTVSFSSLVESSCLVSSTSLEVSFLDSVLSLTSS